MNAIVALILIGALGFAVGRFLFLRPQPGTLYERFMLSGAEFLVIGAVIGPSGLQVLDRWTLTELEPFLVLALSWIGLLLGIQLRWRHLIRFPWPYFQVSLVQGAVTLVLCFGVLALVFGFWTPVVAEAADRWRAALCLGAVAALSSSTEAALHEPRAARGGHPAGLLRFVPAIDPLITLAGVGLLFAFWHSGRQALGVEFSGIEWLVASVGGGLLLGALFLLLLASIREPDEAVLAVLGMAVFSGGLASVFHLSPLVVGLIEGMVISNWRRQEDLVLNMFLRLERPLYVALLVLAGAAWRFDEPAGYLLALLFMLLRVGTKFLGVRTALAVTRLPFAVSGRWWLGLVPQGAMAIAVAVSYVLIYDDALGRATFSAILVSTVVLTLLGRPLVRRSLRDEEPAP